MSRRRLSLVATLISATFLISFIPAQSANITGTKCTKVNSTKVISNIKYTCIKSGKKLFWNKGISVKTTAAPTPTLFLSASPTPSPISERPATAAPTPTPTPLTPAQLLLQRVNSQLTSQLPNVDLNTLPTNRIGKHFVDPQLPAQYEKTAVETMKKVAAAWDVLRLTTTPTIYVSDSIDWIITNSQSSRSACKSSTAVSETNDWMRQNSQRPYSWALAECLESTPIVLIPVDPSANYAGSRELKILTATGSDLGYMAIGKSNLTSKLPTWFVRGLKEAVSEYIASMGSNKWSITYSSGPNCANRSLNEFNYSYENTRDWCGTLIGLQVSRLMIAEYGLKEVLAFSIEANKIGYADFNKFLGMPLETYEKHAQEYMKALGVFSA